MIHDRSVFFEAALSQRHVADVVQGTMADGYEEEAPERPLRVESTSAAPEVEKGVLHHILRVRISIDEALGILQKVGIGVVEHLVQSRPVAGL